MKKVSIAILAAVLYFTGNFTVETIANKLYHNCEYSDGNTTIWKLFQYNTFCPASINL